MTTYQVWLVYKNKGLVLEYYVVNTLSKKVQSVWQDWRSAAETCYDLNQRAGIIVKEKELL